MKTTKLILLLLVSTCISYAANKSTTPRVQNFTQSWKFTLADSTTNASATTFDDSKWRALNLPHDWSIESDFGKDFPASPGGGALPGGLGWYRKTFTVPLTEYFCCPKTMVLKQIAAAEVAILRKDVCIQFII